MNDRIHALSVDAFSEALKWKNELHMYPEVAFSEVRTTELICRLLDSFGGIEVRRPLETGAVGIIKGGRPGRTLAFRADIDALPVEERVEIPCKSKNPGVMHACGHDANMAMLLGAAKVLSQMRDEIAGEIRLIFQPAEEVPHGGAKKMVEAGVLDGVDFIFGAHADTLTPVGCFLLKEGPMMASSYNFDLKIVGRGGHAAFPDQSIDSISIAAELIMAFNNVISREMRALDSAVVSVTRISAGNSYNVLPDEVELAGTVRVLQASCEEKLVRRLREVTAGICALHGAEYTLALDKSYSALSNEKALYDAVRTVLTKAFGEDKIIPDSAVLGGEDFSEYLKVTRGFYYKIGGRRITDEKIGPHHSATFRLNDDMLLNGIEGCVRVLTCLPENL